MKFYISTYSSEHGEGFEGKKEYPHVELVTDDWDDFFEYETLFRANFHKTKDKPIALGEVKILSEKYSVTRKYIDKYFEKLDETYCSLGQSVDYYYKLKELNSTERNEILDALNDIAINNDVFENFENKDGIYKSLRRFSEAEKAFNEAKNILEDTKIYKNLKFTFECTLDGLSKPHIIKFDFKKENELPNRINALVGKNGTGKTKILSNLASQLSGVKNSSSSFHNNIRPSFSKYIAISYSVFDDFNKPFNEANVNNTSDIKKYTDIISQNIERLKISLDNREENEKLIDMVEILEEDLEMIVEDKNYVEVFSNTDDKNNRTDNKLFSYVYCGLHGKNGLITEEQMRNKFIESYNNIIKGEKREEWKEILSNIIEDMNILDELDLCTKDKNVSSVFEKLSSGQAIMLFIMTEVIANITEESLLLFDEPELHLHPNAISNFMRMLNLILDKFNSYAIISTHSPIIIQEIPSKYVKVFQRNEDNTPRIEKLYDECFGENLSNITNYIFDVIETESNYKSFFKRISKILDKESILELFNNDLSFNALTYLNSLYCNDQEEDI